MVQTMSALGHSAARQRALEAAGLLHPHPELVTAPLFDGRQPFFLAVDKVQVKYEMLRAHIVDGQAVTTAAADHGYSRPALILAYLQRAEATRSGAELADEIERLFHITLHRRTVERARRR